MRLRARPASVSEVADWDGLVEATGRPHLLQLSGWAAVKAATGWTARRFVIADAGSAKPVGVAQVLLRSLPLGLSIAYAPRGPLVASEDLPDAIVALARALAAQRCASLLCDPEEADAPSVHTALAAQGIRPAGIFVQPRRTLLLDLRPPPEELLGAMKKKTRQYIHKAERAGVVTEGTDDLDRYLAVLRRVAARDRFALHDRAYFQQIRSAFGDGVHLTIARVGNDDVGALLVVRRGDRAWEMYGGWSGEHADARPFYLLKWRSISRMRELGAIRYDMWGLTEHGVSADRSVANDDPLAGVEQFKVGFGGDIVSWIGAVDVPVRAALYPLWRLAGRRRLAASA
ncbi:MAG TPA: peptidoglycan bridge formation glycyltransferase FemA/FemB family protein [Candidatus Limnocylindria bacterium]